MDAVRDWSMARGFGDCAGFAAMAGLTSRVLDGQRSELVEEPTRAAGKRAACGGDAAAPDSKAAMALKSHSEAERRRRERINAHLTTLRGLVPSTDKLDKAALLAEVISHVTRLKCQAAEISKVYTVPSDVDEVIVEVDGDGLIKATLCCEDRPELLAEINRTILSLELSIIRADISTLGGRMKNVIVMLCNGEVDSNIITATVQQALKSTIDRITPPVDFLPSSSYSNKSRRISLFESSSSSSTKSALDRITLSADFLPRPSYSNKRHKFSVFESSSSSS